MLLFTIPVTFNSIKHFPSIDTHDESKINYALNALSNGSDASQHPIIIITFVIHSPMKYDKTICEQRVITDVNRTHTNPDMKNCECNEKCT